MTWIVERDERLKIIKNLDIQAAKKMLPTNMTDTGLLIALHKLRYESPQIESELRNKSGKFLRANGFCRINGLPLLPDGELPE
jgi:hypothetical protein|tara:strand:+ start:249 stop:497 length:249 start_codon:yes stop_codon:yes gene_type:complete